MSSSVVILLGVGVVCLGLFGVFRLLDRCSTRHAHHKA